MQHIKGPDFPTAGIILGRQGILDAYETGRGRVRVRAKAHTEDIGRGKEAIIVTELPYMVKKGGDNGLVKKIADLVHEKRLTGIANLEDQSDRRGMRLVVELKRDAIPEVVLNQLYKHTPMQTTFGVNMVALVDNVPRTLPLRRVLVEYVQHQREVIVRRSKHELGVLERRVHVLEGLLIAQDNLDAVIETIRASRDRDAARVQLIERFSLSDIQASAILDMRLSQLTALEAGTLRTEHADKLERISELRAILGDEQRVLGIIKEELLEISERFGDERRTLITDSEDEIDIEDLIADQQMVITITKSGYIKSLPLATYRQQHRGGRGVTGMDMKDGDYIEHLFVTSSHDYLLFFSNRGKVYRSKVYELPEASRTAKGRALVNVLPLREGERIQSVLSTRDFTEGKYLIFATRRGVVKKTDFIAYNTPIKADGIIAINIRDDDELVAVRRTSGDDDILMVSRKGQAVRFHEDGARAMGRDTSGVRGMDVSGPGRRGARDGRRARRRRAARRDRERLRQAHRHRPVPQDEPRGEGRRDDQAHRGEGRPGRRARRARAPGAGVHLARGHGAAHRRARDQPVRPPLAGRARDEHPRRRRRQRGRARHGVRARGGRRGGRRRHRFRRAAGRRVRDRREQRRRPHGRRRRRAGRLRRRRVGRLPAQVPVDGRNRRGASLLCRDQRKEVVRIDSSSSCGTLEVTGR